MKNSIKSNLFIISTLPTFNNSAIARLASIILFILILPTFHHVKSAKILSLSLFASRSHKNVYEPLLVELSQRGHHVTIVSPVPSSRIPSQNPNLRDIVGIHVDELINATGINVFVQSEELQGSMYTKAYVYMKWVLTTQSRCSEFYSLPQIQSVLQESFDLIFINPVSNECLLGMVYVLDAPTVFITTLTTPYWVSGPTVGTPTLPSIQPLFYSTVGDDMNFIERFHAFICHVILSGFFHFYYYPYVESIYKDKFGNHIPSVVDIYQNTSLILSNSHLSVNFPRIAMPNEIDVGGMHCRPAKPLPKDLDEFLSGPSNDQHGFIYFSFGSMIQANVMPVHYRNIFLSVFSKLQQRVLWKWENETLGGENLPENIKISSWVPQQDVLGHSKIHLFITHGGLLSTEEAVYHGVPLLGFPMYGDQEVNMDKAENLGFALKLKFGSLTEDILMSSILNILNEPKFKIQAQTLSQTFRDRPKAPLDEAIYWTEYVLRHSGAEHLKSPARKLNFLAYYSIDVIAVAGLLIILSLVVIKIVVCWICCCGWNHDTKKSKISEKLKEL